MKSHIIFCLTFYTIFFIEKPPLIPKYSMLPQVSENKQRLNPKNSLRRSNTYKTLKKVSEINRASAPMGDVNPKNNDFSLLKELERMSNIRNLPGKDIDNKEQYSRYPNIYSPSNMSGIRPPPVPSYANQRETETYYNRKDSGNR